MTRPYAPRSDKLVRAPEAFRLLGICNTAGYRAIKDGTLPIEPIKIGGQWKFRRVDVERITDGPINTRRTQRRFARR